MPRKRLREENQGVPEGRELVPVTEQVPATPETEEPPPIPDLFAQTAQYINILNAMKARDFGSQAYQAAYAEFITIMMAMCSLNQVLAQRIALLGNSPDVEIVTNAARDFHDHIRKLAKEKL